MIQTDIELGDYVRNNLTNTEGYVSAIADHLTGCTRIGVRPRSQDPSEHPETHFNHPAELSVTSVPNTVAGTQDVSIPSGARSVRTDPQAVFDGRGGDPQVTPGHVVEDEVSGTRGLVGIVTYRLFNCPQACVFPDVDDGYATDNSEWIDVPRLEVVDDECVGEYDETDSDDPQSTGAMGNSMNNETLMSER